jgi:hypothetical protein
MLSKKVAAQEESSPGGAWRPYLSVPELAAGGLIGGRISCPYRAIGEVDASIERAPRDKDSRSSRGV